MYIYIYIRMQVLSNLEREKKKYKMRLMHGFQQQQHEQKYEFFFFFFRFDTIDFVFFYILLFSSHFSVMKTLLKRGESLTLCLHIRWELCMGSYCRNIIGFQRRASNAYYPSAPASFCEKREVINVSGFLS